MDVQAELQQMIADQQKAEAEAAKRDARLDELAEVSFKLFTKSRRQGFDEEQASGIVQLFFAQYFEAYGVSELLADEDD